MFGFRPEGRALTKGVDPITRLTPYIMPTRDDAQCYTTQYIDYDALHSYIREKRKEGHHLTTMSVILAAYVRTISQFPALNRFVVGRTLYARRELTVSLAIVKVKTKLDFLETTVKMYFDPRDTVFEVAKKVEDIIEENKKLDVKNNTDKVANVLLSIPGLVAFAVGLLKILDWFGIMPRAIIDASPFHTSMFITNMASLGMREITHHLYNFGTTTVFFGLGKKEMRLKVDREGHLNAKAYLPLAATIDERVAAGAIYSMAFDYMDSLLRNPAQLEAPPETVLYDHRAIYVNKR